MNKADKKRITNALADDLQEIVLSLDSGEMTLAKACSDLDRIVKAIRSTL